MISWSEPTHTHTLLSMAEEPREAKSEYSQSAALDHNHHDLQCHGNRVCLVLSLDWDNNLINRQSSDLTTNVHAAMAFFGCHGYSNSLVRLRDYRTVTYKKKLEHAADPQWKCFQVINCTDSACGHHSSLPVFVLCSAQTLVCTPSCFFLTVFNHICTTHVWFLIFLLCSSLCLLFCCWNSLCSPVLLQFPVLFWGFFWFMFLPRVGISVATKICLYLQRLVGFLLLLPLQAQTVPFAQEKQPRTVD